VPCIARSEPSLGLFTICCSLFVIPNEQSALVLLTTITSRVVLKGGNSVITPSRRRWCWQLYSTVGQGDAGSITIKQADTVFLDGQSKRGSHRSLLADTRSSRDAGALTINTRQLIVQNRAQVSAKTSSTGRAGTLLVNDTESVTVDGKGSALDFDTLSRRGDAEDLRIFTQRLVVQNGETTTSV
jgi:hypothetical protein